MSGPRHALGNRGRERDHVVLDGPFDFVDARRVDGRMVSQKLGGIGGNDAEIRKRFGSREFDFEPLLKTVLVTPDTSHIGTRISRNQKVKTSVGLFCSAITRRVGTPRCSRACAAPIRTIS